MNEIYAINADGIRFQELDLHLTDLRSSLPEYMSLSDLMDFSEANLSLKSWWPKIGVEFSPRPANPKGLLPDISLWYSASLVLSPKAYRFLEDLLNPFGEFLPIHVGKDVFYIFNCMTIAAEDESMTEYESEDGVQLALDRFSFKPEASENIAFKSVVQGCSTLYCNEKLKAAVEGFGLSGVVFDRNLLPDTYGAHNALN